MPRAQCRGEDRDLFFPPLGTDPVKARVICSICPVRQECLDYALPQADLAGIWAGTSAKLAIKPQPAFLWVSSSMSCWACAATSRISAISARTCRSLPIHSL